MIRLMSSNTLAGCIDVDIPLAHWRFGCFNPHWGLSVRRSSADLLQAPAGLYGLLA